jgi:asparagine synthetase B (glutamine-hydrolysing)
VLKDHELNIIKDFYEKLSNNKHKSIPIALKRLNSCMLRHDEEDTVLDATIALEVLLSDDGKTEMTHKLALRVAALSKLDSNCKEKPKEIFAKIKKVYTYRSGIVHGTKDLSKSKVIKIPESAELKTVDVAIEMLKMVLRVLLCNDKYLDVKSIDEDLLLNN